MNRISEYAAGTYCSDLHQRRHVALACDVGPGRKRRIATLMQPCFLRRILMIVEGAVKTIGPRLLDCLLGLSSLGRSLAEDGPRRLPPAGPALR
jgi:hypothetical protein